MAWNHNVVYIYVCYTIHIIVQHLKQHWNTVSCLLGYLIQFFFLENYVCYTCIEYMYGSSRKKVDNGSFNQCWFLLAHRLLRWPKIGTTLVPHLVFCLAAVGIYCTCTCSKAPEFQVHVLLYTYISLRLEG